MNPTSSLDRVFPLSHGSPDRQLLRAPRLAVRPELAPVSMISTATFRRAWAMRRKFREMPAL